ncbi:hypothetical protein M8J77_021187 [Diaphorina citri]|nr:hypothetical protein M8J77_021187 [Diaphorina citri]
MYSSTLMKNLPASSRVSYVPRPGYSKAHIPYSPPPVDDLHLSRKCGFTIPLDPDVSLDSYLDAIGNIVGDKKLVFSGINNGAVKIYLSSEFDVNLLFDNHPQVVIEGKGFLLKRLDDQGHRIYLCNVEPVIPETLLVDELSKYVKVVSPMRYVSLGIKNPRFSHLLGYRRMVSVDDIEKLPPSFNISYDNKSYKIFTMIDKVKCFRCNTDGHLSRNCPKENNNDEKQTPAQDRLATIINNEKENVPVGSSATPPMPPSPPALFIPDSSSLASPPSVPAIDALTPSFSQAPTCPSPPPREEFPSLAIKVTDDAPPSSPPVPSKVVDQNEVSVNPDEEMVVEVIDSKNKKRSLDVSPININSVDKKACTDQNIEQTIISPLIEKHCPTMDPVVFFRLMENLKNKKNSSRKHTIITKTFDMDPNEVASLLDNLSSEMSLDSKIKSKYKNLAKSIRSHLMSLMPNNDLHLSDSSQPISPNNPPTQSGSE